MYTKEQEEIALREYERLGSIAAVIHQLGYPSESTLYRWYERKKAGLENRHGCISETPTTTDHHCNTPGHPRHPTSEFKYEVIHRCFELGEDVEYVSRGNRIQPYEKLLTDITEFAIPNGKLYLSAMIDCFDEWLWAGRSEPAPMPIWSTACWMG